MMIDFKTAEEICHGGYRMKETQGATFTLTIRPHKNNDFFPGVVPDES